MAEPQRGEFETYSNSGANSLSASCLTSTELPAESNASDAVPSPLARRSAWKLTFVSIWGNWLIYLALCRMVYVLIPNARDWGQGLTVMNIGSAGFLWRAMNHYRRFATLTPSWQVVWFVVTGLAFAIVPALGVDLAGETFGFWGVVIGSFVAGAMCSCMAFLCKTLCDHWADGTYEA